MSGTTFWGLLFSAALLHAQVDTGALTGQVYDATGAVVPEATIRARNLDTNYKISTTTNRDGRYVSPPLPAGPYRVSVERPGFHADDRDAILTINQRLAVDFTLEVGAASQTVRVEAQAQTLQTDNSTLSTLRSDQEIENLPNNGRIFNDIVRFSPGVVQAQAQISANALSYIRGNTSNSVNGASFAENNFLVDGIQINENHQGYGTMMLPELEAIEEYQVATSVPDARFSRAGATVNVAYKSGASQFHGALFEFLRNDLMDARNFFSTRKPPFRRNQFGATLGGPLGRHDPKMFFFLSYEGTRVAQTTSLVATVPTLPMRAGIFTQLNPVVVYNPLSTTPLAGGGFTRTPFPNNTIPASMFNLAGAKIANFYPTPSTAGLASNLQVVDQHPVSANQGTVKIDRDFGAGSRMFVRFTDGNFDLTAPTAASLGPIATPYESILAPTVQVVPSYTYVISPRTVNQVRFGFTRENLRALSLNGGQNTAQQFGIPNVNVNSFTTGIPTLGVSGYPALGDMTFVPAIIAMNNFQYSDNLNLIRGNHSLTVGFDAERRQTNVFQDQFPRGNFSFSSIYTNNPSTPGTSGASVADLLLGAPDSITLNGLDGTRGLRHTDWDWYVQDDWKITPRLALNLGLRYELFAGYPNTEVSGRVSKFDLKTGTAVPTTGAGVPASKKDFGPRVGFAYKLSNKTVIRSAWGVYYTAKSFAIASSLTSNPPYFLSSLVTNDQANFTGARTLTDGPLRTSNPLAAGQSYIGINPSFSIGNVQQWNFSIQRELPSQQQLTVAYVGSKGTHILQNLNINQAAPGSGAVNARRPYTNDGTVTFWSSGANSIYNSLQVHVTKRFSSGLQYQAAYTWSHFIDGVASSGNNYTGVPINNLGLSRGNDEDDLRHQFRATVTYELPFGRGKTLLGNANSVVSAIVSGWQTNAAITMYTGFYFTVTSSSNTLNIGETVLANRICNPDIPADQRTIQHWFNASCFTAPSFLQWGNAGRNTVEGPYTHQVDFSIFRNIALGEKKRLQFRAEAFNLSNTPQFNNPGASGAPNATFGTPSFGSLTSTGSGATLQRTERQLQMGLKLLF